MGCGAEPSRVSHLHPCPVRCQCEGAGEKGLELLMVLDWPTWNSRLDYWEEVQQQSGGEPSIGCQSSCLVQSVSMLGCREGMVLLSEAEGVRGGGWSPGPCHTDMVRLSIMMGCGWLEIQRSSCFFLRALLCCWRRQLEQQQVRPQQPWQQRHTDRSSSSSGSTSSTARQTELYSPSVYLLTSSSHIECTNNDTCSSMAALCLSSTQPKSTLTQETAHTHSRPWSQTGTLLTQHTNRGTAHTHLHTRNTPTGTLLTLTCIQPKCMQTKPSHSHTCTPAIS